MRVSCSETNPRFNYIDSEQGKINEMTFFKENNKFPTKVGVSKPINEGGKGTAV